MFLAAIAGATLGLILSDITTTSPDNLPAWISSGGLLGFLLYFVVYAIPKRKWVTGDLYDEGMRAAELRVREAQEREAEWREIALTGTQIARRQLTITEAALARSRSGGSG